jgi:hybrid cluster-associated redox disulfide protein
MVSELNDAVSPPARTPEAAPSKASPAKGPKAGKLARGETIGADNILGEILAAYPETEKVFRKYYGDGCFSCPGQATESVKQSAMMHNVSEKQLLAELNLAAGR